MISEGSWDWSNNAEDSALITGIKYMLQQKTDIINCNNNSQNY